MRDLPAKRRRLGWLILAVCAILWAWLLAVLPIPTAAMGKAAPLLAWLRAEAVNLLGKRP